MERSHLSGRGRRPPTLPRRPGLPPQLELADIQGNVLRGYTFPDAAYLGVELGDFEIGRRWLTGLIDEVTTAEPWNDRPPETTLNPALSYSGLEALGVREETLATFPDEFREGMAARADLLGDRGPSSPENWDPGLGDARTHVLLTVHAASAALLDERVATLREGIEATDGACGLVYEERAQELAGGQDHFGFYDGISQPVIEGSGVAPRPGDGLPDGDSWRALRAGEFILGYEDEDGGLPEAPVEPLGRNGTFAVYRKLHMDVALFRRYVAEAAEGYPGGEEMLAAKIVGRWRDGTPLALSPDRPDPDLVADPGRINNFRYGDDPSGLRCPIGAHVRRASPRDSYNFHGGLTSFRHRIIRRGRSYGPPLPEDVTEDDGEQRGLIFTCFNASIQRQFETIQALWVDDGDPFGLGDDKDFLIGNPEGDEGRMVVHGDPPYILARQPRFVTTRGGEYLFRPGINALRWIAAGAAAIG
jgi:Dyp-type peroxidase family